MSLKISPYVDSFDEFEDWFANKFVPRNGGYIPGHRPSWFKRIETSHEKIRKFLGGMRFERKIKLKSQQQSAKKDDVKKIVQEILRIVPDYLEYYGYKEDVFLLPTIPQGTHSLIRVGKHLRTHADARFINDLDKATKLKQLDKLISQLGEIWAKSRTSDLELEVNLTTSPKSFVLLGHYGPDQDSCFRQGSDKTSHKYVLAQSKNTFVLVLSKIDEKKGKVKNLARCYGFTNDDFTVFNCSNYYFAPGFQEGDCIEAIKTLLKELWNDEVEFYEDFCRIRNDIVGGDGRVIGVFQNPYGKWSFVKGKGRKLDRLQEFVPNVHMIQRFTCPKCGREATSDRGWADVDGEPLCSNCVRNANTCDISGKKTFKDLVMAYNDKDQMVMICQEEADILKKCPDCNVPHAVSYDIGTKSVCSDCLEANYSNCDSCDELVSDEELEDVCNYDICKKCREEGNIPGKDEFLEFVNIEQE